MRNDGGEHFDTASGTYGENRMVFYPVNCMHCENPSCVDVGVGAQLLTFG